MMRPNLRWMIAPVALLLSSVAWPSTARLQDTSEDAALVAQRARFEGVWRLAVSHQRGREIIDAAAERAASAMPFFTQSIARSRLSEGTQLYSRVELRFESGGRLMVRFADQDSYTTRIGRTERRQNRAGEERRVTQRFRPSGELEQVFETDDGTRWYVWTITGEGRARLEVTTNSSRMAQPMRFTLDYRRE